MKKYQLLLPLVLSAMVGLCQLIPGDVTDGPNVQTVKDSFEMPRSWQRPYISTYYVEPTQIVGTPTVVKFFVTDFENSKIRFSDNSHRFSIIVRYSKDNCNTWTEKRLMKIEGGDGELSLGLLSEGDYTMSVQCIDGKGRQSHVVWHEFRVIKQPKAPKCMNVTKADLKKYGIRNDGDYGRIELIDVGNIEGLTGGALETHISNVVAKAASTGVVAPKGYTVFAAAKDGAPMVWAWRRSKVVYGKDYNKKEVEELSYKNADGLNQLLANAKRESYNCVVLPKGTYRISAYSSVIVPSGITLDLNGATIKMNEFTGASARMLQIIDAIDSHVINGTVEGDYYEHDYLGSPNNSEWPMGISISGDSRYSSFENVTVKNITGYGAGNGLGGEFTYPGRAYFTGKIYEKGEIDMKTGLVNKKGDYLWTSGFQNIAGFRNKYITVSKYLGYQGIRTKSWNYIAAFYDADKKFISAECAYQYRVVLIPKKAWYMRITIVEESLEKAEQCDLTAQLFRMPWNCTMRGITFDKCRAVGYAPAQMRNMLIENCTFTRSGENLARCAFDAEDGWDMMQDVTIRNNVFKDNPFNELLLCAGHNMVIEGNTGGVYLWGRVNSACVRNNTIMNGGFHCNNRNRTGYGRYLDNKYLKRVRLGLSKEPTDWDIVITGNFVGTEAEPFTIDASPTGRFRNSTFSGKININGTNFEKCTFNNSIFVMTTTNFKFKDLDFVKCDFQHCNATGSWTRCTLTDCKISSSGEGGNITFTDSKITRTPFDAIYWTKPMEVTATGSTFDIGPSGKYFLRLPAYSIGDLRFENNSFKGGRDATAIAIYDARPQNTDNLSGSVFMGGNNFGTGFSNVLRIEDTTTKNQKKLVFTDGGSTGQRKPKFVNKDAVRATWKVVEKKQ